MSLANHNIISNAHNSIKERINFLHSVGWQTADAFAFYVFVEGTNPSLSCEFENSPVGCVVSGVLLSCQPIVCRLQDFWASVFTDEQVELTPISNHVCMKCVSDFIFLSLGTTSGDRFPSYRCVPTVAVS